MCVLCSRQFAIFLVSSYPWKLQYARFSVITFIVIIGCYFSVSRLDEWHENFFDYFNVLMTVELSSFKIGKASGCKPETFFKKYL